MGNEANALGEMDLQLGGGGSSSIFGGLFSRTNAGGGLFTAENGSNWASSLSNGGAWGKTMMGASGGSGSGGGGIGGAQYFNKALVGALDMWNTSIQTDTAVSAYKSQAKLSASDARFQGKLQSEDLARQGESAVKNIGIVQRQGIDSATLRYNALGAEIARQRVSAAGSGIDLSSNAVSKVEQASRRNAAWDVSRISRNTKIAADNYNAQAEMAFRNSAFAQINSEYAAKQAEIQGELNSSLAEISGKFGMIRQGINIGVNVGKGIADIYSGGWVSAADGANSMAGGKPLGEV